MQFSLIQNHRHWPQYKSEHVPPSLHPTNYQWFHTALPGKLTQS